MWFSRQFTPDYEMNARRHITRFWSSANFPTSNGQNPFVVVIMRCRSSQITISHVSNDIEIFYIVFVSIWICVKLKINYKWLNANFKTQDLLALICLGFCTFSESHTILIVINTAIEYIKWIRKKWISHFIKSNGR